MVFVRPRELRMAEWADIHLDVSEWRYTVTKTNTDHIVPLSSQALARKSHQGDRKRLLLMA